MNTLMKSDGELIERADCLLDAPIAQKIDTATQVAGILSNVVKQQKLATTISGRDYVRVEGWTLLGNLCGLTPREDEISEAPDGTVQARVSIVDAAGVVRGAASSIVGMDEKTWASRPRYARRSMAVTRATGKAFRLALSWVMTLSGFEVTPFEEMPADAPTLPTQETSVPKAPLPHPGPSLDEQERSWKDKMVAAKTLAELDDVGGLMRDGGIDSVLLQNLRSAYRQRQQQIIAETTPEDPVF